MAPANGSKQSGDLSQTASQSRAPAVNGGDGDRGSRTEPVSGAPAADGSDGPISGAPAPDGSDGPTGFEKDDWHTFELARRLNMELPRYTSTKLHHRRFRHRDLQPVLKAWQQCPGVVCHTEGYSAEGRSITRISMGSGPVSVLLWSQMHGNEPTATMALCDVMQFLTASDSFDEVRRHWLSRLTLHMVPMLNPDAAERFERCTPEGIDLNRDARRRQRPESVLLKKLRDRLQADVAFNLHDQNPFYAVGDSDVPAALALMAPPADMQGGVDPVRRRAMQLVVRLRAMLEAGLPGRISAWDDAFEPRAFGDNMQRWGSSTVLVESGTLPGDPEKQQVRHWTTLCLLQAFEELSTDSWKVADERDYLNIPPNRSTLYSSLFKGVRMAGSGDRVFRVDVGCRRHEVPDRDDGFFVRSEIDQIGDLEGYFGYEEVDASEWTLRPLGVVTEQEWCRAGLPAVGSVGDQYRMLTQKVRGAESGASGNTAQSALRALLEQGVGAARLPHPPEENYTRFPINLMGPSCRELPAVLPGAPANFCFVHQGRVVCSVVNGWVWRFDREGPFVVPEGASGMVFR